ncbi:MAG: hypothetical protein H6622_02445 [Halobacteriovoraceae bacterium]|nr:hypothetical protein [Halobacteriovoraceae bacterium]
MAKFRDVENVYFGRQRANRTLAFVMRALLHSNSFLINSGELLQIEEGADEFTLQNKK